MTACSALSALMKSLVDDFGMIKHELRWPLTLTFPPHERFGKAVRRPELLTLDALLPWGFQIGHRSMNIGQQQWFINPTERAVFLTETIQGIGYITLEIYSNEQDFNTRNDFSACIAS